MNYFWLRTLSSTIFYKFLDALWASQFEFILCSKQYNKNFVLHLIVALQLRSGWWHNYSTKTRQAGRANEQSMYSLMSMGSTVTENSAHQPKVEGSCQASLCHFDMEKWIKIKIFFKTIFWISFSLLTFFILLLKWSAEFPQKG